jgi:cytoskeletal protein CcmA (bactofilin family)
MFSNDTIAGKKDEHPRTQQRPGSMSPNVGGRTDTQIQQTSQPEPNRGNAGVPEQSGSALVVGPNIKMKGVEVTDCDTVIVEGHIEASLDSRVVQVKESGLFVGAASMDIAEIWGRFEGELTARRQLIVHPTGRVHGNVRYGKVQIEEGGEISGQINTLSGEPRENAATTVELEARSSVTGNSRHNSKVSSRT